jgi:hypothetical protein
MHTYSPRNKDPQLGFPIVGFQKEKLASVIPSAVAMRPHWSLDTTKWNSLQLATIPGWIGVRVATPLPAVVGLGRVVQA